MIVINGRNKLGQRKNSFAQNDFKFKTPNLKSIYMNSLRPFAEHSHLSIEIINEALRVARKKVVAKERIFSRALEKLGFKDFYGSGARGSTKYGGICKI